MPKNAATSRNFSIQFNNLISPGDMYTESGNFFSREKNDSVVRSMSRFDNRAKSPSPRLRIHASVLSRVHVNTNTCNSWLRNPEDGSAGRVKSDNVSAVNKGLLRETCVYPPSTKRRPVTASGDSACGG